MDIWIPGCCLQRLFSQQRSPLLEVKGNIELKRPLVKASSRLPLPGSRLKRGPDQMEDALEPEKVSWVWKAARARGAGGGNYGPCSCLSLEKDTSPGHHDQICHVLQSTGPHRSATDTRPDGRWVLGVGRDQRCQLTFFFSFNCSLI